MRPLGLDRLWDGTPAPAGVGGAARLEIAGPEVVLAWDVALRGTANLPDGAPRFLDGLWEHDVVELFLAPAAPSAGPARYLELEAGAGGHWLALALADVRVRGRDLRNWDVRVEGAVHGARWRGRLRAPLADVRSVAGDPPWRGMAAAGLGSHGERVLLASTPLPGDRADFHQPSAWPRLD